MQLTTLPVPMNSADFDALTVGQLREVIASCLRNMADNLVTLARAVQAAEAKGDDLSDLKIDLLPKLRLIACGQLLPDVLTRGWPVAVVQFVSRLPVAKQRELVDNTEGVPVAVYGSDGKSDERRYGILEVFKAKELKRVVIAADHIRSIPEQRAILDAQRIKDRAAKPEKVGRWKIDRELQKAKFGSVWHPLEELESVVKAIKA